MHKICVNNLGTIHCCKCSSHNTMNAFTYRKYFATFALCAYICVYVKHIPYGQSMSIVSTCNFWSTIWADVSYNGEECNCNKCASTNMYDTTDPNLYVFYPSQSCRSYVATECPVCKTRIR